MNSRFRAGSKLGAIHVPTWRRSASGTPPHVSSPGSPGLGIVRRRQSSSPVRASCAVTTQASGPAAGMQLRPEIALPLTMIGPVLWLAGWVV